MRHLPVGAASGLSVGQTRRMATHDRQPARSVPARRPGRARHRRIRRAWAPASPGCCTRSARRSWCRPGGSDRLDALVADLPGSIAIAADLAIADDRERLVTEALERAGRIDVLVNNAGISYTVGIEQETLDAVRAGDAGQHDRRLAPHQAVCTAHGRAWQRIDRQRGIDARSRRFGADQAGELLRQQGRGRQHDPRARAPVVAARASG